MSTLLVAGNINFSATAIDSSYLNGQNKTISYQLTSQYPNWMKETVTSPALNRGEVYTYYFAQKKKTIYYPMLDQTVTTTIDVPYLKSIFDALLTGTISSGISVTKNSLDQIITMTISKESVNIQLSGYQYVGNYSLPSQISIYQKGSLIEKIQLNNMDIQ